MMTLENAADGMEYSAHLTQWKAAFQSFYGSQQPSRETSVQADVAQNGGSAVPAKLPDGSANPYAAVLTGLQSLLDGPLFKGQQPSEEAIAAATGAALAAAQRHAAADDAEQEAAEDEEEEEAEEHATASAPVSSAARSPPGSRRPRKRQAASSQADEDSLEAAATPAAAPAGRQPAAKKRRNTQATSAPNPPPASASLNDLATLAAAVAEEPFDDPVLGDQQQQQDQGLLAAYQSGSLGGLSAQMETAGTSGRGGRGGNRSRQRTPAPSSSGADEGDSLGVSFPLVNEDGKPLTKQQIKRLRRQQSNRESARRSRQRKAEEANMLARRVGEIEVTCNAMQAKNATLVAEVQQLRSIIEMMAGDSSALAAQVGELGGTVPESIMANINWLASANAARGNWLASGHAPQAAGGSAEQAA